MAFFSEIYVSNLLGKKILTADEKEFGRIYDLVVNIESESNYISKLLIKTGNAIQQVSWEYVQSIEVRFLNIKLKPGFRSETWSLSEEEFYIKKNLLDKQVVDTRGRKVVRVNDVKLAELKGSMVMVAIDIGLRGLLRRLGWEKYLSVFIKAPELLVNIEDIEILDSRPNIHLKVPYQKLSKLHPADFADIMEQLDTRIQLDFLNNLDIKKAAEVFQELERKYQLSLIKQMGEEKAADVIENMETDDATDLLEEMHKEQAEDLFDEMDKKTAEEIRNLMKFDPDSAGGIMNTDFVTVYDYLTVYDVIDYIKKIDKRKVNSYYLYAVDTDKKLTGVLSLKELITANPNQLISELINKEIIIAKPNEDAKDILRKISKYDILAIPVIDSEKRILGIVTVDDAIDILGEEIEQ